MRQKILFADLNHYETTYLQKELCGRYETVESFYAEDTLRILSQEYQDTKAILIGWELFWANDYACIRKIKGNPDYQLIPVVVIDSSHSEAVDNVFRYHEALRHGALGFFSAPFDVPMIQTFLNSIILLGEVSGDTLQVPDRQSSRSKQFETLIQHFNGGITIAYDGFIATEYAYINEPFFSIFGYTQEEFLEELSGSIYNLILPAYVSEVKAALGNSATQIKPVQFVFQAMKKDGSKIWIRCRSSIHYLNAQGQIAYIIFYDDITALKKTEERIRAVNDKLANSEIYLHLNLKERVIEDYRSVYEPENQISQAQNKNYMDFLLAHVYEPDREQLWKMLAFDSLMENYSTGNTKLSCEYRRKMPNGTIRWFAATVVLIEGMGEADSNALIYAHDINDKMKTQIAKDRVADLEVNDIAIVNIASGKVTYIKKHRDLSGGKEERPQYEDILEQLINVEIAKEDRERCRNYFRLKNLVPCISEHGSASISYLITTKKGNNIRANVSATYLDETHEDILLLGRDITVLFEKEQEQQMALQHAVELADFANQSKSQFLSRMSHDMRTPLNAILGLTRLAQDEKQVPALQEYCNSIRVSGEFLLGLINDLLDLSKIESGKMEFHREVFSLEEFLLGIDTVIRPLMEAKKIDFIVRLKKQSSLIVVDKMRFNQVFYNLLSNAVKYTPEGGRVEFWSEYIPQKEKKLGMRFHVCDNGIGMSKKFLQILFDPYSQEYGLAHKEQKGTGLGLSIAKQIVELAGGQITVKSELGKGTEFIVDVYAMDSGQKPLKKTRKNDILGNLQSIHVLVVDDTEINSFVIKKLLEYKGCNVDVAMNGQEAIELFTATEPYYYDIILTDIGMPIMDGFEEARQIRAMEREDGKTIPIIAATADGYDDMYAKILEAGMNERLVKPINAELLYETILRLIKK